VDEIKPGVPNIIEPLTAKMERPGIAPKMISDFRQLWGQLLPRYIGKLVVLPPELFGNEAVCCDTCNAEIVVRRVN
jgi:hypothetical protein